MNLNKKSAQKGFTLIEILVVIGIIAVLATIVLIAINPARQFAQARNTQRVSNVNAILNAVGQYVADNKGTLPTGIPSAAPAKNIATAGANLCSSIMPTYISSLPSDPQATNGGISITDCSASYDTEYTIIQDASGRVTVAAPKAELSQTISITR